MNTIEVKISLLKAGLTEAAIAGVLGISQPAVHLILSGQRPGYKYQTRISRMLGIRKADLFGNGKPKRRRRTKQKLLSRITGGGAA